MVYLNSSLLSQGCVHALLHGLLPILPTLFEIMAHLIGADPGKPPASLPAVSEQAEATIRTDEAAAQSPAGVTLSLPGAQDGVSSQE